MEVQNSVTPELELIIEPKKSEGRAETPHGSGKDSTETPKEQQSLEAESEPWSRPKRRAKMRFQKQNPTTSDPEGSQSSLGSKQAKEAEQTSKENMDNAAQTQAQAQQQEVGSQGRHLTSTSQNLPDAFWKTLLPGKHPTNGYRMLSIWPHLIRYNRKGAQVLLDTQSPLPSILPVISIAVSDEDSWDPSSIHEHLRREVIMAVNEYFPADESLLPSWREEDWLFIWDSDKHSGAHECTCVVTIAISNLSTRPRKKTFSWMLNSSIKHLEDTDGRARASAVLLMRLGRTPRTPWQEHWQPCMKGSPKQPIKKTKESTGTEASSQAPNQLLSQQTPTKQQQIRVEGSSTTSSQVNLSPHTDI